MKDYDENFQYEREFEIINVYRNVDSRVHFIRIYLRVRDSTLAAGEI